MIIGTAGHIDHGKSSLMQALTGVHTDRLPEEKRRGISIELGYAFLPTPDGRSLAFVDVPGHEKLIHTMVSGATGMNHALLLIAADDGVMPQTREHFAILSVLGVPSLWVVVTKIDLVDAARLQEVHQQVDELLAGSAFENTPRFPVSSVRGEGIPALRTALMALPLAARTHSQSAFRMAVDRSFSLNGVGTVIAGSVQSGCLDVDTEVAIIDGSTVRTARVRGLHAQNTKVTQAQASDRCAINLANLNRDECPRGSWVVAPGVVQHSQRVDVSLTLWRDEDKALRSGTWVHVHLGTQDCLATVAILQSTLADQLQAGEQGMVQLVFKQPVSMWWGDRFLIRDTSASRTLGGGRVLDPQAPARYRRTDQRLAVLSALACADPAERLLAVVNQQGEGLSLDDWLVYQGLQSQAFEDWMAVQPGLSTSICRVGRTAQRLGWGLSPAAMDRLWARTQLELQAFHDKHPDELGPDLARLRRMCAPRLDLNLWQALVNTWIADERLCRKGAHLHLPEHAFRLSESDRRISEKALPLLRNGKFDPPWVRDVAAVIGEQELMVRVVFSRLASQGLLYPVVKDLFYPHDTLAALAAIARQLGESEGEIQAARFRDLTGLGRKRAIQILEFFDRVGLLRRSKDRHLLRRDSVLFDPETESN